MSAPTEERATDAPPLKLDEAPEFRPTAEEFADPLKFIASIRQVAEPFGICKIIPPEGWKPTCAIDKNTFKFPTRIQCVNELQDRSNNKFAQKRFLKDLDEFMTSQGKPNKKGPVLAGQDIDLFKMFKSVQKRGGYQKVTDEKTWKDVAKLLKVLFA